MCGRRLGKKLSDVAAQHWSMQQCDRPVDAADVPDRDAARINGTHVPVKDGHRR